MIDETSIFVCFCNQKIDCFSDSNLGNHIKNCAKYKSESPISKIFFTIPLKKLENAQLLALKHEYLNYISILEGELNESFLSLKFFNKN